MSTLKETAELIHLVNPMARYFYLQFDPLSNGKVFICYYSEKCVWDNETSWFYDENGKEITHPLGWFCPYLAYRYVGNTLIPKGFDLTPYKCNEEYNYDFRTAEYVIDDGFRYDFEIERNKELKGNEYTQDFIEFALKNRNNL